MVYRVFHNICAELVARPKYEKKVSINVRFEMLHFREIGYCYFCYNVYIYLYVFSIKLIFWGFGQVTISRSPVQILQNTLYDYDAVIRNEN